MTHKTTHIPGTDARNHIARCSCGWAYSGTYKFVNQARMFHEQDNCAFRWDDKRRKFLPDSKWWGGQAA